MDIPFYTLEEGMEKLKYMVQCRETSKDISLYDIWVKDCEKFANKLIEAGVDKKDIATVLNWETAQECYCGIFVKEIKEDKNEQTKTCCRYSTRN